MVSFGLKSMGRLLKLYLIQISKELWILQTVVLTLVTMEECCNPSVVSWMEPVHRSRSSETHGRLSPFEEKFCYNAKNFTADLSPSLP